MNAAEIRRRFLEYFKRQGHAIVPSSPLIPRDDPSLLFTNAGMVQFKKTFLAQEKRPYVKAASSQKCLRVGGKHNDLENVGRTARHHTFFEMLGNFSFGDYFKAEAISLAWEFLTRDLGLDKSRLYVTVYRDDDEAFDLWRKVAGVEAGRIFRLGEKDNFWSMGDTGPCGPCSEIHFDQGPDMACGPDCGIGKCDCDRFLEVWNLVFMQYDQTESGQRVPLPRPSIDTGMGLERVTAVVQGVRSNYETDLFMPLIDFVAARSDTAYKRGRETDTALQVIADHSRAIAFLIADQVLPSNEGRGYVLRRLIRRAFRFGRLLGLTEAFLFETVREVSGLMAGAYPELEDNLEFTVRVVREEEERFSQTLDKGLAILEEEMDALAGENSKVISGDLAFKLYDTFGFPLDIVNDVAERRGMSVDEAGFRRCMDEQKKRAKKAWKGSGEKDLAGRFESLLKAGVRTIFSGYDATQGRSVVKSLLDDQGAYSRRLVQGQGGWLVAEETPFYGESGGQTGDVGGLETMTGSAEVLDTLKPSPELTVHKIFVNEGEVLPDQEVRLSVDVEARLATARNHTCTHLLHAALRRVLGGHVKQSGSLVGPDRLRFDFTHIAPLTPEEIARVEEEVNRAIIENHGLRNSVLPYEEAVAKGAMALFGEKYADQVRMVEVPGVSVELCGGTHLSATGQAGSFVILSESGIAAGVRRIEAATGWNALAHFQSRSRRLDEAMAALKSGPDQVAEKIRGLQAQNKDLAREAERLSAKLAGGAGQDLLSRAEDIAGVKVLAAKVEAPSVKALREQVDGLRSRLASGIICLLAETGQGKVSVILSVSKDLLSRFTAPALIKDVAAEVNGGGGGRPDLAQAGGTDPAGADRALDRLRQGVAAAK